MCSVSNILYVGQTIYINSFRVQNLSRFFCHNVSLQPHSIVPLFLESFKVEVRAGASLICLYKTFIAFVSVFTSSFFPHGSKIPFITKKRRKTASKGFINVNYVFIYMIVMRFNVNNRWLLF